MDGMGAACSGSRRPWRLGVAVALAVSAVPALVAASAADAEAPATPVTAGTSVPEGPGSIGGQVSEAGTNVVLPGIEVCAYPAGAQPVEEEESEPPGSCAKTDAQGEYTISGLPPESYVVLFATGPGKPDFISVYYDQRLRSGEAVPVVVAPGTLTAGVNAELSPGAEISGAVTEGGSGAPIAKAGVFALRPEAGGGLEEVSSAETGVTGEYTLAGLPTGSYTIAFAASGYETELFDGVTRPTEATPVAVTAPGLTTGIDAEMTIALGDLTLEEPGLALGPTPAAGRAKDRSARREGTLSLLGRRLRVPRRGVALVRLGCAGAEGCRARLTLRVHRAVRVGRGLQERSIVIGTSRVISLGAGHSSIVRIPLRRAGLRLLRSDRGRVHAELAVLAPSRTREMTVTLSGLG